MKNLLAGKAEESRRLAVTLDPSTSIVAALAAIEESGYAMESLEIGEEDARRLDVVITTAAEASLGELLDRLVELEGVRSATLAE